MSIKAIEVLRRLATNRVLAMVNDGSDEGAELVRDIRQVLSTSPPNGEACEHGRLAEDCNDCHLAEMS
jgi:thiamine phosphate synthase YjbQ (UPF0047 family)